MSSAEGLPEAAPAAPEGGQQGSGVQPGASDAECFASLAALSADWYWEQDAQFRFVRLVQGPRAAGFAPEDQIGRRRWELPGYRLASGGWAGHAELLLRRERFRDVETRLALEDGSERVFSISGEPMLDAAGSFLGYRGVGRDITAARRSESLLASGSRVLELVALGEPLPRVLEALAREIEGIAPGLLCSILLLDQDGRHLHHGTAPSLPEQYCRLFEGVAIGPDCCSCGTAAFRREPVVVADIATDPLWEGYRDQALACGLRACWSSPIFDSARRVLGTFALYYRIARQPAPDELQLVAHATKLAAIAIERLRTETALREGEERLAMALDAGHSGAWDWNVGSGEAIWSVGNFRILGLSPGCAKASHATWLERVHPEDRERVRLELDRAVAEQRSVDTEFRVLWPDGTERWLRGVGKPRFDESGVMRGMIGIQADITERKRGELLLRESEERLRRLLDTVPTLAVQGYDRHGTVNYWNRANEAVYGYTAEQALGHNLVDLIIPPEMRDLVRQDIATGAATGQMQPAAELWLMRRDGSRVPVFSSHVVVRLPGREPELFCMDIDLTSLKEAERAVRELNETLERRVEERTSELEAVNQELESFSYSVSHDLRAPLRAINGFAHILQETDGARLSDEGREALRRVTLGASRMGQLIDDLLRLSRVSRQGICFVELDLEGLIRSLVEESRAAYPSSIVVVGRLPWVIGDEALLRIAFTNLLDNALKFSSRQPQPRVEIGAQPGEKGIVVSVRDNGVGFDMQYAGKLFGVFQRMNPEAGFPGTGVGLAIVKRIVDRHGGRVRVETRPGQGASFFVTLPAPGAAA